MEITTQNTPYGALITPGKRLDVLTSKEFQSAIEAAVAGGAANLVLDFSGVEYVSSSGLRVLLTARRSAKAAGGVVLVCGISEFVQSVFETTGFEKLFNFHATVADAEKSLGA